LGALGLGVAATTIRKVLREAGLASAVTRRGHSFANGPPSLSPPPTGYIASEAGRADGVLEQPPSDLCALPPRTNEPSGAPHGRDRWAKAEDAGGPACRPSDQLGPLGRRRRDRGAEL